MPWFPFQPQAVAVSAGLLVAGRWNAPALGRNRGRPPASRVLVSSLTPSDGWPSRARRSCAETCSQVFA